MCLNLNIVWFQRLEGHGPGKYLIWDNPAHGTYSRYYVIYSKILKKFKWNKESKILYRITKVSELLKEYWEKDQNWRYYTLWPQTICEEDKNTNSEIYVKPIFYSSIIYSIQDTVVDLDVFCLLTICSMLWIRFWSPRKYNASLSFATQNTND